MTKTEDELWRDVATKVAVELVKSGKYDLAREFQRSDVSIHAGRIADGIVTSRRRALVDLKETS